MTRWLISYQFRRAIREPSGKLEWSNATDNRMELIAVHPAIFIADAAAAARAFTEEDYRPDHFAVCDQIELVYSVIEVPDGLLTDAQQKALEEVYSEPDSRVSTDVE